jgi:hypothetical protein
MRFLTLLAQASRVLMAGGTISLQRLATSVQAHMSADAAHAAVSLFIIVPNLCQPISSRNSYLYFWESRTLRSFPVGPLSLLQALHVGSKTKTRKLKRFSPGQFGRLIRPQWPCCYCTDSQE